MTRKEYETITARLEAAVATLRANGCLLQALARKYYVVYITATYAAVVNGLEVTHSDGRRSFASQKFHHNEMADVIRSLYTGHKRGTVTNTGACPGIVGANLSDGDAWRFVEVLQQARKIADYGPGEVLEPFTEAQVDERLQKAAAMVEDLRKII
jgi:hypothetical protein